MQEAGNFVADQVFPNIPVSMQSDRYYTYDRGYFNRDEMQERAPGTESAGSGYEVDNTPGDVREHRVGHEVGGLLHVGDADVGQGLVDVDVALGRLRHGRISPWGSGQGDDHGSSIRLPG